MTYRSHTVAFSGFTIFRSITLISIVVVAGVGVLAGGVATGVLITGGLMSYFVSVKLGWHSVDEWLPVAFGVWVITATVQDPDGFIPVYARLLRRGRLIRRPQPIPELVERTREVEHASSTASWRTRAPRRQHDEVLAVNGLTVRYGAVVAVDDVSFSLSPGSVLGVIGPNGAGKTSLIDALSGFAPMAGGRVTLGKIDISQMRPHQRARQGLVRTFQNLELFDDITVRGTDWPASIARLLLRTSRIWSCPTGRG